MTSVFSCVILNTIFFILAYRISAAIGSSKSKYCLVVIAAISDIAVKNLSHKVCCSWLSYTCSKSKMETLN